MLGISGGYPILGTESTTQGCQGMVVPIGFEPKKGDRS